MNRRTIAAFLAADLLLSGCGTASARLVSAPTPAAAQAARQAAAAPALTGLTQPDPPRVSVTRGPAPVEAPEHVSAGAFAQPYNPQARYTATASDTALMASTATAEGVVAEGGGAVGPVGASWGLIGGAIGGVLVGGSLIGYAIYTGMVGTKDLLYPTDMEDLVKKPDAYGWAYTSVAFQGHDGTDLKGWYVPAEVPTTKAVLMLHGHTSNKDRFLAKYGAWLHHDYNMFFYDSRFHGESAGTITTLGWHERRDAAKALEQLKTRGNTAIGVMGESMGGAVAIGVAADKPEIKAVWADCAFDSLHDAIAPRAKNRNYPLPNYVAWSVVKTATIRSHHNVASADPIRCIGQISPRPVYLVHGEADDSTTPINSEKLYVAAKFPKTYWTVPGAKHAESWKLAPAEYQSRVHAFFAGSL